jgi:hypothetical protein
LITSTAQDSKDFLKFFLPEIVYAEPVANITEDAAPEAEYNSVKFSVANITLSQVKS